MVKVEHIQVGSDLKAIDTPLIRVLTWTSSAKWGFSQKIVPMTSSRGSRHPLAKQRPNVGYSSNAACLLRPWQLHAHSLCSIECWKQAPKGKASDWTLWCLTRGCMAVLPSERAERWKRLSQALDAEGCDLENRNEMRFIRLLAHKLTTPVHAKTTHMSYMSKHVKCASITLYIRAQKIGRHPAICDWKIPFGEWKNPFSGQFGDWKLPFSGQVGD